MSQRHFSTGEVYSSTHAALYMRKGSVWGNVSDSDSDISNHTTIAREPTNTKKLNRYAIDDEPIR